YLFRDRRPRGPPLFRKQRAGGPLHRPLLRRGHRLPSPLAAELPRRGLRPPAAGRGGGRAFGPPAAGPDRRLSGPDDIHPATPTRALPGTPEKVAVLMERARLGQALWHPQDATHHDAPLPANDVSLPAGRYLLEVG